MYFLKPFGLDRVPKNYILIHSLLYGFVTFSTTAANLLLLPQLLPKWFDESRWTVGKELFMMIWQIITISLANVALAHILYGRDLSFATLLVFLGYTSAVGIFPIGILVLLKYIKLLKKYQETARSIGPELFATEASIKPDTLIITLLGDYQNEVFKVRANHILYVSTADNYIQVFYLKDDTVVSVFLRSTLKKAEESLSKSSQFFRCHRTYLVNLHKIEHISGNAQGLKLHMQGSSELIPVSRSLNQQLKQQMQFNSNYP